MISILRLLIILIIALYLVFTDYSEQEVSINAFIYSRYGMMLVFMIASLFFGILICALIRMIFNRH